MIRHSAYLLWPVAAVLAVLTVIAVLLGADWPSAKRGDFALIVFIMAFFLLMVSVILRRMHSLDLLSLSFGAVFLAMAGVYLYAISRTLWPMFTTSNLETILWVVRLPLLCSAAWATVMLIVTPDPEIEQQRRRVAQRKEGRAEGHTAGHKSGHAAGRTAGHAEGMAQEHAEQLEREDAAQ